MVLEVLLTIINIALGVYFYARGSNRITTYTKDPAKQAEFIQNRGRFYKGLGIAFIIYSIVRITYFLFK